MSLLRPAVAAGMLAAGFSAELLRPRRAPSAPRGPRWLANLGLMALGSALAGLALPMSSGAFALWVEERRWGLLHQTLWPLPVKLALGFLFLDLTIYWQHRLFHELPWLWRLHQVHHTDLDLDASSGVRFHPIEILLSMLVKFAATAVFGVHFLALFAFEVVLNAVSTFHHSAIALPGRLDAALRLLLVTPDYHRVHHCVARDETNSNYCFNLTVWDRLFRSYVAQPRLGHAAAPLGIESPRDPAACASIPRLLALPFERRP